MLELPPCCRLMITRWPSGENRGAKLMFGEIADDLALTGLDVEQIDPRRVADERHVGDFLRRRREARRQHQIVAAGQSAHVGAVLIHDGEALDALVLRPDSSTKTTRLSK